MANNPGFTIERLLTAPAQRVWDMWTTAAGIAKWWGPIGFTSTVKRLDVRAGGEFEIVLRATGSEQVSFLASTGVPLESSAKGRYVDVQPLARLAMLTIVDFVPGVAPYEVPSALELKSLRPGETTLSFHTAAMHDPRWSRMAEMGWTQQIDKLVGELS